MAGTRSSARQTNGTGKQSNPDSAINDSAAGHKHKSEAPAAPKAKRGRNGKAGQQKTIEETLPAETEATTRDVQVKVTNESENNGTNLNGRQDDNEPDDVKTENVQSEEVKNEAQSNPETKTKGDLPLTEGDAVVQSSQREASTPSSILEKGIIYFFFRGRVNIDEPSNVGDVARSYIVLRPLPHGAKLGDGPIGDEGNNRLLALPKKVLPVSPQDRFMIFVDRANCTLEDIKANLASSDYATKTAGTRHTPAATPIGEGVYAITTTGRESHITYFLTIPSELSDVQRDVGLRERGSFVASVKNPQYEGPANTNLPKGPQYPQEILDEFRSLRWMPLQPRHIDHENSQFILIGSHGESIDKATEPQCEDQRDNKDTPLEELEKLENEDEIRVNHLEGDDSVFVDLGLSSKEYPKVQTTW